MSRFSEQAVQASVFDELWTVSEINEAIQESLRRRFADEIGLIGEISNLARPRSGHIYMSLKDAHSQVRAVVWKNVAQRLVFQLKDGLSIRAWGRLEVYVPRGEYQLVLRRIEPEGIGALELAFRQLVEKLTNEGLFDPARKRPLPRFPRRIIVVTSPTGAAVRDFLHVVQRRWPAAEVLIAASKVQGEGAAREVAAAIALANQVAGASLIVLARGGGSLEDLWTFNEEVVARAIHASRLPVVSAIGHEVDVTIADMVADLRAPTPTAAGSLCVPDVTEIRALVDRGQTRLGQALIVRTRDARRRMSELAERAKRATDRRIEVQRHRLSRLSAQLDALSPLGVLARGYSLTQRFDDGSIVRSAAAVSEGDLLRTRLARGAVISRVVEAVEMEAL